MSHYFVYGEQELEYLATRDPRLGWAIEQIGFIKRETEPDFFPSIVRHIIGQQISIAAQNSIFQKLKEKVGSITTNSLDSLSVAELQSVGLTFRKAEYIKGISQAITTGEFNPSLLAELSDKQVIQTLCSLRGIGVWTAEMLMLFSLQRSDVVSYGDLAIIRGMRMLYQKEKITKKDFESIRSRYSPYGSIASLYLWAIARGVIKELSDPASR